MGMPEQIKHIFIPDAPIVDPSLDLFERWPFAQRLAKIVSSRTDPSCIVIGIYGAWGEGKTTVLNFIEYELKKSEAIICVRFNPWRFKNETVEFMPGFWTVDAASNVIFEVRLFEPETNREIWSDIFRGQGKVSGMAVTRGMYEKSINIAYAEAMRNFYRAISDERMKNIFRK
jgi:hypothetical protein